MSPHDVRFLADECCDFAVVRALRAAGYDVYAVGEVTQRSDDAEIMAQATQENRILLTEDKDFGWLVFVSGKESAGVILMRFPGNAREALAETVRELVLHYSQKLVGAFTVVQPGQTRINPGPGPRGE